jgi:hypothetical protein
MEILQPRRNIKHQGKRKVKVNYCQDEHRFEYISSVNKDSTMGHLQNNPFKNGDKSEPLLPINHNCHSPTQPQLELELDLIMGFLSFQSFPASSRVSPVTAKNTKDFRNL